MRSIIPHIELTVWPLISLVVLIMLFLTIFLWVINPKRKDALTKLGNMPLED